MEHLNNQEITNGCPNLKTRKLLKYYDFISKSYPEISDNLGTLVRSKNRKTSRAKNKNNYEEEHSSSDKNGDCPSQTTRTRVDPITGMEIEDTQEDVQSYARNEGPEDPAPEYSTKCRLPREGTQ